MALCTEPLLAGLILLPLAGGLAMALAHRHPAFRHTVMVLSTWSTLAIGASLRPGMPGTGHGATAVICPASDGAGSPLAVGGISILLIWITALLFALSALPARWPPSTRDDGHPPSILLLEAAVLGTLVAGSRLLLVLFWSLALALAYRMSGMRVTTPERVPGSRLDLFPRALAGSVLLLLSGIAGTIGSKAARVGRPPSFPDLWGFWAFFLGFMVPAAVIAVQTWIPGIAKRRPQFYTPATAVLPALGLYGILRLALPEAFGDRGEFLTAMWVCLAVVVYGALKAVARRHLPNALGFVWLSYIGFAAFGLFSGSLIGMEGGVLEGLTSTLAIGALAILMGQLRDRTGIPASDPATGGLIRSMPGWVLLLGLFTVSAFGLPGTAGFVGEFLTLLGSFPHHPVASAVILAGSMLTTATLLSLFQRLAFGPPLPGRPVLPVDLNPWEWAALIPLATLILTIGFFPAPLVGMIQGGVHGLALPPP